MTSDVVTGTVEHQFGGGNSLRNLTRFGRNYLDRVVTPPRAASAGQRRRRSRATIPTVAQIRRTDTKYQYRDDKTFNNQTDLTAGVRVPARCGTALVSRSRTRA